MAGAHQDYTSAPWFDEGDAASWAVDHQDPNFTLEHGEGCPRRDQINERNERNTTMVEAEASSSAIMTSACPTCGQGLLPDFTNTQTELAQADQRQISFAEASAPASQAAPNWSLWDPTYPARRMSEVDEMLGTGSVYWQPPEHNKAEIARFDRDIDAMQAQTMSTNVNIDPRLLGADIVAPVPVHAAAEKAEATMPSAVGLQHPAYPVIVSQIDNVGEYVAVESHSVFSSTIIDLDAPSIPASDLYELESAHSDQLQQDHAGFISGAVYRQATVHQCLQCVANFSTWDGLRHHLEKHTDKAHRYKCTWEGCSYAGGRYPKDLARHERIHDKPVVPPFPCEWASCSKRFHRKDYVLRHLRTDHADPTVLLEVPTSSPTSSRNLRRMQSRSSGRRILRRTPSSASAATLSSFDSAEMSSFSDHLMPPPQNVLADMRRVSSSFREEVRTSFDDSSSVQSYAPLRLTPRTSQSSSGEPAYSSGHNSFQGA